MPDTAAVTQADIISGCVLPVGQEQEFGIVLYVVLARRVNFQRSKPPAELDMLLVREFLIRKDDHNMFEPGRRYLLENIVRDRPRKIDAAHFGAKRVAELFNRQSCGCCYHSSASCRQIEAPNLVSSYFFRA